MATNCPICGKPENECTCGCCRPCPGTNPCVDMPRMSTPNYHLLLYRASDVTSWLIDYNNTMCTIDKVLHGLALRTNTIDEIPQELVDAVEQLETDVAGLKQDVCNLTADGQNMSTQVANMQTAITNLQQAVQTLTFNTTNLDTRMTTAETAIQAVQNSLTKITENVNTLVTEVAGLKEVDENLKTELDALAARVNTLEDTADTTAAAIQALNTQVQDLEEKINSVTTMYTSSLSGTPNILSPIGTTSYGSVNGTGTVFKKGEDYFFTVAAYPQSNPGGYPQNLQYNFNKVGIIKAITGDDINIDNYTSDTVAVSAYSHSADANSVYTITKAGNYGANNATVFVNRPEGENELPVVVVQVSLRKRG